VEPLNLALAIGFLIFLASFLVLYALFKRPVNLRTRLNSAPTVASEASGLAGLLKRLENILIPIGEMLPRSTAEMSRQERRLVQAGIRRKDGVLLLNASHVLIVVLLLLGFTAKGFLYRQPMLCVVLSLFGGAALPDIWLKSRTERRKENIQHALPDAMDLAVVSVEAGLGLDQALMRVGQEIRNAHPDLSEELYLRNVEVNMGRSRADAFRNLAERTGVEDLKALVAILIQTDKFGTSVGQALRTFSDALRTKRRQRAEEKAAKLAIKMVLPMVVFIFPGVFIVILGPAFIAIVRDLLPKLAGH
jgi:tight adherence protein C